MRLSHENISFPPGESLRLLRWEDNVGNVTVLGAGGHAHPYEGAGETWHCHAEMELTLITRGSGTRSVGDCIQRFDAPDVLLIGPNLPHCWIGLKHSSGFAVQFLPGTEPSLWNIPEAAVLREIWAKAQRGMHLRGGCAARVIQHVAAMPEQDALGRFASLLHVLDIIRNAPAKERPLLSSKTFIPSPRQAVYRGMKKAMDVIMARYQEPLDMAEMLRVSGMSRATFARQFRKYTGRTFIRFLNEVRIDQACRQLLETEAPIGSIAYAVGFAGVSHFNHCFSALRRISPRQYRRRGK